jgi:hypothetical protein
MAVRLGLVLISIVRVTNVIMLAQREQRLTGDWPDSHDMREHRRTLAGLVALSIAAVCICLLFCLLFSLLWPRNIQNNDLRLGRMAKDSSDSFGRDTALIAEALPSAMVPGVTGPIDPKAFGGVAPIAIAKPSLATADASNRLANMDAGRQTRQVLWSASGSLSASAAAENLADIGAVVQGVNDQLAGEDSAPATSGPIQSYPMSAAAVTDLQNRAARYGAQGVPDGGAILVASADVPPPHPAGARSRAFDASEGTPLDPLLNTTYDLNYPKAIPSLK